MQIRIIKYDGTDMFCNCDSFEFRTNHVSNWIRIKKGSIVETIHDVATIKGGNVN